MKKKDIPTVATPQYLRARKERRVDAETFVDKAHYILNFELEQLKLKSESGKSLNATEASKLCKYIDCVTKIAREMREQKLADANFTNLTDDQILKELPPAVRKALKEDSSSSYPTDE